MLPCFLLINPCDILWLIKKRELANNNEKAVKKPKSDSAESEIQ